MSEPFPDRGALQELLRWALGCTCAGVLLGMLGLIVLGHREVLTVVGGVATTLSAAGLMFAIWGER